METETSVEFFGLSFFFLDNRSPNFTPQCEAPQTIAKLVYNSNNYGLWYANKYSEWGFIHQLPTYNWGGPHIVKKYVIGMEHPVKLWDDGWTELFKIYYKKYHGWLATLGTLLLMLPIF